MRGRGEEEEVEEEMEITGRLGARGGRVGRGRGGGKHRRDMRGEEDTDVVY